MWMPERFIRTGMAVENLRVWKRGSVPNTKTYVINYDYGDDDDGDAEYYARYQSDRFASGMWFTKVEEINEGSL